MATGVPPVDGRTYERLLADTRAAIRRELKLAERAVVPGDPLVKIFARLAEIVLEHINRVPDKNLFAFLSMLGVQPEPPRPARVPLTFTLAAGAPAARLPAGSMAAADPGPDAESLLYETEFDLDVTSSAFVHAFVRDPAQDRYRTTSALVAGTGAVPVFEANTPIPHELYVGDALLALPHKDVTLRIDARPWPAALTWSFFDGVRWKGTEPHVGGGGDDPWVLSFKALPRVTPTAVGGELRPWLRATLDTPLTAPPAAGAVEAGHVRDAGLTPDHVAVAGHRLDPRAPFAPFGPATQPVEFAIACERAFTKPGASATLTIDVDDAHHTTASSDLQLTWMPAGAKAPIAVRTSEQDQARAFCTGGAIAFDVPDAWPQTTLDGVRAHWLTVTVTKGAFAGGPPTLRRLRASYDWPLPVIASLTREAQVTRKGLRPDRLCCNERRIVPGHGMLPFGATPVVGDAFYVACDEAFCLPGAKVTLTVEAAAKQPPTPPTIAWDVFDGASGAWVPDMQDVTLGGSVVLTVPTSVAPLDVGGERRFWVRARVLAAAGPPTPTVTSRPDGDKTVTTVELAATIAPSIDGLTIDCTYTSTATAAAALATRNDFTTTVHTPPPAAAFTPFVLGDDRSPTLYLAFDGPGDNAATSLFLDVVEAAPAAGDRPRGASAGSPPVVTWEYRRAHGWAALGAVDETRGLTAPGLVRFIAPADMTLEREFEVDAYWLRARWERGAYRVSPRLRRILTNTTWATSGETVRDEILGSSAGEPNQRFRIARIPVLAGERIEVLEPSRDADERPLTIAARERGGLAVPAGSVAGVTPLQTWVPWQAVSDFYESGPLDRHYAIDPLTGTIEFGDGLRGRVPPVGHGNVRAASYRCGGGSAGNRPAGAITRLRTVVPAISAVRNELPARGGADAESLAAVGERGPRTLRHRNRAVTAEDIRDLAHEASPEVALVHVVSAGAASNAGEIGVIVVPQSAERPPVPGLDLLACVRAHLEPRLPAGASLWVAGPGWLRVAITTEVVAADVSDGSDLQSLVRARLDAVLDPLSTRSPPAFGRAPRRSDLFAAIHAIAGVDHVRALSLTQQVVIAQPVAGARLAFAGEHTIVLTGGSGERR